MVLVGKLRAKCTCLPQSRPPPPRAAGQTQEPFGMDVGQLPVRSQERLDKWACGLACLKGTHTVSFREGGCSKSGRPSSTRSGPLGIAGWLVPGDTWRDLCLQCTATHGKLPLLVRRHAHAGRGSCPSSSSRSLGGLISPCPCDFFGMSLEGSNHRRVVLCIRSCWSWKCDFPRGGTAGTPEDDHRLPAGWGQLGGETPEALWSGSREPWGASCNVGSSRGSPTHCLPLPQEKRLSIESGLSADSHLSAGTASQGEPEGPLAEEEGLSQQEPMPATQEDVMEETYEEVRLALGATCSEAGLPAPTPPRFQAGVQAGPDSSFRWAPSCTLPCVEPSRSQAAPGRGEGLGRRVCTSRLAPALSLPAHAHHYSTFPSGTFPDTRAFLAVLLGPCHGAAESMVGRASQPPSLLFPLTALCPSLACHLSLFFEQRTLSAPVCYLSPALGGGPA